MGFLELLTLIFVICKLLGVISWSWLLVFSPLLPDVLIYIVVGLWLYREWKR